LGKEVEEELTLRRDLGQGFFQIMCKGEASAQKILMRTPHHSRWGTSILQPWCAGFNPWKPEKMRMHVWVTLKDVPGEYRSSALDIAESLGPVLGKNRSNTHQNDQRFCVVLTAGEPFPITVEVINPVNGKSSLIAVDYNNLPIRCRHCLSTLHLVKDCSALKGRGTGANSDVETTAQGDSGSGNKDKEGNRGTTPDEGTHEGTRVEAQERIENPQPKQGEPTRQNDERGKQKINHRPEERNHRKATPLTGSSASVASSDPGNLKEKQPNPSFRGVRQLVTDKSTSNGEGHRRNEESGNKRGDISENAAGRS
jgi:hypothetical protein